MRVGLFGYGSLLLQSSFERTLGSPYTGGVVAATLPGWKRLWSVSTPNDGFRYYSEGAIVVPERILYLNVEHDADCVLNGLVYVVSPDALERFDRREHVYDRVLVNDQLSGWRPDFPVYLYTAKPEARVVAGDGSHPSRLALRLSYLETIRRGLALCSEEFRAQFSRSTDPPPAGLIVTDFQGV